MQKTKNSKKIIFFTIVFLVAFVLISFFAPSSIALAGADDVVAFALSNSVRVEVINRDDQTLSTTQTTFSNRTAYSTQWSESKEFRISYVADEANLPQGIPTEEEDVYTYTLTVNVEFLKGYRGDEGSQNFEQIEARNIFERVELEEDVDSITVNNLSEFEDFVYVFDIDTGISQETELQTQTANGWGIYRFTININQSQYTTDFYIIEPSGELPQPRIQAEPIASDNSLYNSYSFTLINADEYRYIDERCLKWYIDGEGVDGTKYALLDEDLGLSYYDNTYVALWAGNYQRTGLEFIFNDNNRSGTYEVWCTYEYHNALNVISSDRRISVETGNLIDYTLIIYIVVALAVVSVVVTIVICVVKKRKEKVW